MASVANSNEEYGWTKSTGDDGGQESSGVDKIPYAAGNKKIFRR